MIIYIIIYIYNIYNYMYIYIVYTHTHIIQHYITLYFEGLQYIPTWLGVAPGTGRSRAHCEAQEILSEGATTPGDVEVLKDGGGLEANMGMSPTNNLRVSKNRVPLAIIHKLSKVHPIKSHEMGVSINRGSPRWMVYRGNLS